MLGAYFDETRLEAGVDEAGRGCLAGPVVAAAVILPKGFYLPRLNDSKKLSANVREELFGQIVEMALAYGIGSASPQEIDRVNILNATFLAMHRALDALQTRPEALLIDGNRFKAYREIPFDCMIKGDGRFSSIAAASVLAKVHRDRLMADLALQYPQYGWQQNAGYPTVAHRKAISEYGTTPEHRMTFQLLNPQLGIF